jgi:hypothetical protein
MRNAGKVVTFGVVMAILILGTLGSLALSEQNIVREKGLWSDATDVLAGKAANQAGRESRPPLINTEQGNMLVFFFCLGGVAGGFIIGYNWRKLLVEKTNGR